MLTIQRTRGVAGPSEAIAVIERAELGGYEGAGSQFADRPPVVCEVWPGGSLPVAATLPASWPDDSTDYVVLDTPIGPMTALSTGRYPGRIRLADSDGIEIARFLLAMHPGPGDASPRPAYHTYDDLLREQPMIERYIDDLHDETGFAATSAEARDWIDDQILTASRRNRWCRGSTTYADAVAADKLLLDTPAGRRIVRAGIYYTIAVILRRIEGMSNAPDDIVSLRGDYLTWAKEAMEDVRATFDPATGLAPVHIGGMPIGRVVR